MRKLNRPTAHRVSLVKNLATNLLWYGKIETTKSMLCPAPLTKQS